MIFKPARRIYEWGALKANSPFAPFWLGVIFLLEAVLFLPLDALLMLFCMENPQRRFTYALVATGVSVLTAFIGYCVGYLLWDAVGGFITTHLISPQLFERLVTHYNKYEEWAVLLGSLLPVPFKAVTISAGFCKLSVGSFLLFVGVARALRFFVLAEMMYRWGPQIKAFIDRHFNRIVMAIGAKIAIAFTFFWLLSR